jgi:hypothetical protein
VKLRLTIAMLGSVFLAAPAARAADVTCGPHQHLAVETNEDEGGTVKRCVCDDDWNAGGPEAPCRRAKSTKATGKQKPKK